MKKLLAIGLAMAGLLAGACAGPIPAWQDPSYPLQVMVSDGALQSEIRVKVLPPERLSSGQLRVNISVFNATDKDLPVDYEYWFTDAAGRQVEEPLTQGATVPMHGYRQLVITSRGTVEDFRVYLRPHQ
jgi:uncharacterized protein YcfL